MLHHGIPSLGFGSSRGPLAFCFRRSINLTTSREELQQLERLHRCLDQQQIWGDLETLAPLLQSCGKLKALSEGKRVHTLISTRGLERDVSLANCILIMYGKCASVEDARRMFDQLLQRNVVSWTAMIGAYVQCGNYKDALHLFHRMRLECVSPNKITFITVLNACNVSDFREECKMIHSCIVQCGFESDTSVGNSLVSTYSKCGGIMDAQRVFENILERNVVSWTAMIGAFIQLEDGTKAFELFQQMHVEGAKPNWVTLITVLDGCSSPVALLEDVKQSQQQPEYQLDELR